MNPRAATGRLVATVRGLPLGVQLIGLLALAWLAIWLHQRPLDDPDVRQLHVDSDCGPDGPPGLGMPQLPVADRRFWTRQRWSGPNELKVQVWEFQEPGHRLISAHRHVDGRRIVIEPRWEIPLGDSGAACYDRFGIEVTFRDLPRQDYVIEPR